MIDVTRELQLLFPYFLFKYFIKPKEEIKKKKEKEVDKFSSSSQRTRKFVKFPNSIFE